MTPEDQVRVYETCHRQGADSAKQIVNEYDAEDVASDVAFKIISKHPGDEPVSPKYISPPYVRKSCSNGAVDSTRDRRINAKRLAKLTAEAIAAGVIEDTPQGRAEYAAMLRSLHPSRKPGPLSPNTALPAKQNISFLLDEVVLDCIALHAPGSMLYAKCIARKTNARIFEDESRRMKADLSKGFRDPNGYATNPERLKKRLKAETAEWASVRGTEIRAMIQSRFASDGELRTAMFSRFDETQAETA
tara:strand:- start:32935 stop:33675 length:741 start_codon:yes stop_codon:yes gene_type:complete